MGPQGVHENTNLVDQARSGRRMGNLDRSTTMAHRVRRLLMRRIIIPSADTWHKALMPVVTTRIAEFPKLLTDALGVEHARWATFRAGTGGGPELAIGTSSGPCFHAQAY